MAKFEWNGVSEARQFEKQGTPSLLNIVSYRATYLLLEQRKGVFKY